MTEKHRDCKYLLDFEKCNNTNINSRECPFMYIPTYREEFMYNCCKGYE